MDKIYRCYTIRGTDGEDLVYIESGVDDDDVLWLTVADPEGQSARLSREEVQKLLKHIHRLYADE